MDSRGRRSLVEQLDGNSRMKLLVPELTTRSQFCSGCCLNVDLSSPFRPFTERTTLRAILHRRDVPAKESQWHKMLLMLCA
jgi:hypothetical protein